MLSQIFYRAMSFIGRLGLPLQLGICLNIIGKAFNHVRRRHSAGGNTGWKPVPQVLEQASTRLTVRLPQPCLND